MALESPAGVLDVDVHHGVGCRDELIFMLSDVPSWKKKVVIKEVWMPVESPGCFIDGVDVHHCMG